MSSYIKDYSTNEKTSNEGPYTGLMLSASVGIKSGDPMQQFCHCLLIITPYHFSNNQVSDLGFKMIAQ